MYLDYIEPDKKALLQAKIALIKGQIIRINHAYIVWGRNKSFYEKEKNVNQLKSRLEILKKELATVG